MSNSIWVDPFGMSLRTKKPNQSKANPPPPSPSAPAPAEQSKVHYIYYPTMPCYQMSIAQPMIYTEITYTQNMTSHPFCHQVMQVPVAKCSCNHETPKKKEEKKKEDKKPAVDPKKKKKEEKQKEKEKEKEKEKKDRKNVVPTFANPRRPRKGVFER